MVFGEVDLTGALATLDKIGFYEVALPFILIFTIIFAVLEKIHLFGEDTKNFNVIVALVIALFTIRVKGVVMMMNSFLPKVSMLVLVILMVLLIWGIFGAKGETMTGGWFFVAMILSVGGLIWAVVSSLPAVAIKAPAWLRLDATDKGLLALIAIFALFVWLVTKRKEEPSILKRLGDAFSSGKFREK